MNVWIACPRGSIGIMRRGGVEVDWELSLRPVIREMVRTQVCLPNLKLQVDKIEIVIVPEVDELSGNQAYKLFLTDGESTIQGVSLRLRVLFLWRPRLIMYSSACQTETLQGFIQ